MPTITITNLNNRELFSKSIEKNALQIIHENFIDWMHACGGKGRCTSCKMIVQKGIENITKETEAELKYKSQGRLAANERLACQSKLTGDIKVRVAEINKFPHLTYSD